MTAHVDPRTGSADLYSLLKGAIPAKLTHLDSADVMFTGNGPDKTDVMIGIERKRLGDALQCMQDGRLTGSQLPKMLEQYHHVFLIIEEDMRVDGDGYLQRKLRKKRGAKWLEFWVDALFGNNKRMLYTSFQRWLLTMELTSNVRVVRTLDANETAHFIMALYGWFNDKEWEEHRSLQTFHEIQTPGFIIPTVPMKVAHELAVGVGVDKAIKIAEHFKSVENMVSASEKDWTEVPGIDKVLSKRIYNGIREHHVTRTRKRRGR